MSAPSLPADWFTRQDDTPDAGFYAVPRLVTHLDPPSLRAITAFYAGVLRPGMRVLDLMSSWVSHLPDVEPGHVAGLGLNGVELAANARLHERVVQDLNADPRLPWPDAHFDVVLNALSVQYLTRPFEVYAEVARVLRPGGAAVIVHSHRCFPTKAVRAFRELPPQGRLQLCRLYLDATGAFEPAQEEDHSPPAADPVWVVWARRRAAAD